MDETLYAVIGRKTVELELMHAEYQRLLELAAKVASGEIEREAVSIDLTAKTWNVVPVAIKVPVPEAPDAAILVPVRER